MDSKKQTTKPTPRGVTPRGNSIVISFMYGGKECRETIKLPPTANNIKYASTLLAGVKAEIAKGLFNYPEAFPDSARAKEKRGKIPTVKNLVDEWRETAARALEASTLRGYEFSLKNHILPRWGDTKVTDVSAAAISKWVSSMTLKAKTIRNHLVPLRVVLNDAVISGHLTHSPMGVIKVHKLIPKTQTESDYEVDPFNSTEVAQILSNAEGQYKNLWQFAFWSGLRSSELYALEWGDIDFLGGVIRVRRADVDGVVKKTKTRAGMRDVYLMPLALEALNAQKQYTFMANGRIFDLSNPKVWAKHWAILLRKAKVAHRNPYQCRHTFASTMVSGGESIYWVAKQLGHTDTSMVVRTYGKWLPKDKRADAPTNSWQGIEQSGTQS